jgi:hypothetical protein
LGCMIVHHPVGEFQTPEWASYSRWHRISRHAIEDSPP